MPQNFMFEHHHATVSFLWNWDITNFKVKSSHVYGLIIHIFCMISFWMNSSLGLGPTHHGILTGQIPQYVTKCQNVLNHITMSIKVNRIIITNHINLSSSVITVPADGLALLSARPSAGTAMTKFGGPALNGLMVTLKSLTLWSLHSTYTFTFWISHGNLFLPAHKLASRRHLAMVSQCISKIYLTFLPMSHN